MSQHPEWARTNSLTSPVDRGDGKYRSNVGAPPLTEEQVDAAMSSLNETSLIEKFPRLERQFADPPIPLQTYGLVSFVPSKGATPDKDGIYGFAKIRGNYATPQEANERAEFLIRNVDSYHQIFHAFVGRPFPITLDPKFCARTEEINIRQKATETISEDVKAKRDKEKEDIAAIKQREKELLEQTKETYKADPYEEYTVLKVKKAQLVWTYEKTHKQLEEMKKSIISTREKIAEYETENPSFSKNYFDKYMQARRDAGIPDEDNTEENFVKYMVEDINLDF
jgi:hypothetical protein